MTKKPHKLYEKEKSPVDRLELLEFFGFKKGVRLFHIAYGENVWLFPAAVIAGPKGEAQAFCGEDSSITEILSRTKEWNINNINPCSIKELVSCEGLADAVIIEAQKPGTPGTEDYLPLLTEKLAKNGLLIVCGNEHTVLESVIEPLLEASFEIDKKRKAGGETVCFSLRHPEFRLLEKMKAVAEKLGKELLVIGEKSMRQAVFCERMEKVKPEVAAELLQFISEKASVRRSPYMEILEGCMDIEKLRTSLGLERMSQIYTIARNRGYDALTRLLINPRPKGKKHSKYDFVENRDTSELTLGYRRSLAKGLSRGILERLIYDDDPVVILNLLRNRRLSENDVLKIASRRPVDPEILKVIWESERWISRYVIKRALVMNPFTPTGIALGLLYNMSSRDLKVIASSGGLHEVLRSGAADLLSQRENEKI